MRPGIKEEVSACKAILRRTIPHPLQKRFGSDQQLAADEKTTGKIPKQIANNDLELPHPNNKNFTVEYPGLDCEEFNLAEKLIKQREGEFEEARRRRLEAEKARKKTLQCK